jgi:hypothetical protein
VAQDKAAGGLGRRLLRTRGGDTVTVSMVIAGKIPPARVYLRFRSGGYMVTRPVGIFEVATPDEALVLAWEKVRADKIVESNDWAWVNP